MGFEASRTKLIQPIGIYQLCFLLWFVHDAVNKKNLTAKKPLDEKQFFESILSLIKFVKGSGVNLAKS
jgi:hypothetical protein